VRFFDRNRQGHRRAVEVHRGGLEDAIAAPGHQAIGRIEGGLGEDLGGVSGLVFLAIRNERDGLLSDATKKIPAAYDDRELHTQLVHIGEFGRDRVKDAVVTHLTQLRKDRSAFDEQKAVRSFAGGVTASTSSTCR